MPWVSLFGNGQASFLESGGVVLSYRGGVRNNIVLMNEIVAWDG